MILKPLNPLPSKTFLFTLCLIKGHKCCLKSKTNNGRGTKPVPLRKHYSHFHVGAQNGNGGKTKRFLQPSTIKPLHTMIVADSSWLDLFQLLLNIWTVQWGALFSQQPLNTPSESEWNRFCREAAVRSPHSLADQEVLHPLLGHTVPAAEEMVDGSCSAI